MCQTLHIVKVLLTIWAFRLLHWTTSMWLTTSLLDPNSICSLASILLTFHRNQCSVQLCQVGPEAIKRLIDSIQLQTTHEPQRWAQERAVKWEKQIYFVMIWLITEEVVSCTWCSSHPFSKTGWKGLIDHSLCESLKTLNAGKQSKVTTSLSHLGPVENLCISSLVWKDLSSKFQLLLGKYNTILAAPQHLALPSAGAFPAANTSPTTFQVD